MPLKKNKHRNHTPPQGGMAVTHTIKKTNTQPPQKTPKPHTDQAQRFYIILGTL